MKLSVVIVSYNVCSYLEKCLDSVEKALAGIDSEVFVVDNASTDNTMAVLPGRYTWVRFIANDENLGFARANNIAIRQAQGEYVLLLNRIQRLPSIRCARLWPLWTTISRPAERA